MPTAQAETIFCPLAKKSNCAKSFEKDLRESFIVESPILDCCCKNGSCPMKSNGENASDCCDNCCGGSCPTQDKQTATTDAPTEKESRQTDGV